MIFEYSVLFLGQSHMFLQKIEFRKNLIFDTFGLWTNFYLQLDWKFEHNLNYFDNQSLSANTFWIVRNVETIYGAYILRFVAPQMKIYALIIYDFSNDFQLYFS